MKSWLKGRGFGGVLVALGVAELGLAPAVGAPGDGGHGGGLVMGYGGRN